MSRARRTKTTPCVGICSTTYGDLVCRGCKRFAHEIVAWNGYEDEQKALVWQRLNGLRDQVVAQVLRVQDRAVFEQYLLSQRAEEESETVLALTEHAIPPALIYQVLARLVAAGSALGLAGLVFSESTQETDALEVIKRVDAEVYSRSIAHYEHSFRVTP